MANLKIPPYHVKYLAFEGGGGKGVAYLGAIKALEENKVLPETAYAPPHEGQIEGFSGASAGAITALFLAIGMTSAEIEAETIKKSEELEKFFDPPKNGYMRSVQRPADALIRLSAALRAGKELELLGIPSQKEIDNPYLRGEGRQGVALKIARSLYKNKEAGPSIAGGLLTWFSPLFDDPANRLLIRKVARDPLGYILNFLFEKGVFPGFGVRDYFKGIIERHFLQGFLQTYYSNNTYQPKSTYARWHYKNILRENLKNLNYHNLTLGIFEDLTSLRFAVSAVNVTSKLPCIFSGGLTNNFPLGEAVAISMNLPFVFKPVIVVEDFAPHLMKFSPSDTKSPYNSKYHGLFVDGGLLNNLPIHCFDDVEALDVSGMPPTPNPYTPLNKYTLGIRLTPPRRPIQREDIGPLFALTSHLSDIYDSVMYPSEEGQIRTRREKAQTIDLNTYHLSTMDFSPGDRIKQSVDNTGKNVIDKARDTVIAYFEDALSD